MVNTRVLWIHVPFDMSMRVAWELAALGREQPTLMPLTASSGDCGLHW